MKILLAPNALKGSLSAADAARAMAAGVRQAHPDAEIVELPVSDGGDGLVEVLLRAWTGSVRVSDRVPCERRTARVGGPLETQEPVNATFLWLPESRQAVIEMAAASGLARVADRLTRGTLDPTRTTTRGTGELVRAALDLGAREVLVGLGGSATVDGGLGALAALGARFLDAGDRPVEPVAASLADVRRLDLAALDPRLAPGSEARVEALCDVTNPLLGPTGAARVYGPQKGATPAQVEALEAGLTHLADLFVRQLGRDVRSLPGAGAAGGLGAALAAVLGARLSRGIERVLELVDLDRYLGGAHGVDLVLTAEGRLDEPTLRYGKAPAEVARRARNAGVPCIALAGEVFLDRERRETREGTGEPQPSEPLSPFHPFHAVVPLSTGAMSQRESMARAKELLTAATARILRGPWRKLQDLP